MRSCPERAQQISPGQSEAPAQGLRTDVKLSPFRALDIVMVPITQGGRCALPWADMWLPLRGEE
jgi:hypothetical protein